MFLVTVDTLADEAEMGLIRLIPHTQAVPVNDGRARPTELVGKRSDFTLTLIFYEPSSETDTWDFLGKRG